MSEFTEIFRKVSELNRGAAEILSFPAVVWCEPNFELEHSEEVFLLAELQTAIDILADVHQRLSCLSHPIVEVSQLCRNESGQYETNRGHCFQAGSPIEILMPDRTPPCWLRTRLERDGGDYRLAGCRLPLQGLTVRVRENDVTTS